MANREANFGCDLCQLKFSADGLESFAGALHLPWGKTAAGQFGDAPHSAIGLGDVCSERKHM